MRIKIIKTPETFSLGGSIHIDPSNKGKFTESAKRAGMGVLEYASHILANKDDYSSTQVKRANFAKNASKWHSEGGNLFKFGGIDDETVPLDVPYDYYNEKNKGTTAAVLTLMNRGLTELLSVDLLNNEDYMDDLYKDYNERYVLPPITEDDPDALNNFLHFLSNIPNDKLHPDSTSTSSSAFLILEPEMLGLYDRMDFDDWAKKTFTDNGIPFKVVDNGGNSFYAVTGDPNNPFTKRYYYNLDVSQEEINALKMQASAMDPSRLGYIVAGPSEEELMLRRVQNTLASMDGMTLGINNVPDNMRAGMVATNANLYYVPTMISPVANIGLGALTGYELVKDPYWTLKTANYWNNGLYDRAAFSALGDAAYGAIGILPAASDLARVSEAGVGTVLRAAETMDNAVGDAARTINSNYYKPWQLGKTIDNAKLEINPNSRLYTTTPNSSTSWNYHAFTSDGHPVGEGTLNSSFNGEGNQIGWIQNTSRGSESGASRTIYNAMINDSKATGEPGIISGEDLMSPALTINVTDTFPHTVIGEGSPAFQNGTLYKPEIRLLTDTSGEVPRYVDPSIVDRHQWYLSEVAPYPMTIDGVTYLPDLLRRVWKDNSYKWEPITEESTANWYDWADRARESEIDNAYMKAVQEGDMETALTLRSLHFADNTPNSVLIDENNSPMHAYHNTDIDYTVFDTDKIGTKTDSGYFGRGFYFTPNKEPIKILGDVLKDVYINLTNPRELTLSDANTGISLADNDGAIVRLGDEVFSLDGTPINPREISEIVATDPRQIKSADAVTYFKADDPEVLSGLFKAGDPIPLSMRDDFTRDDTRFAWRWPFSKKTNTANTTNNVPTISTLSLEEQWAQQVNEQLEMARLYRTSPEYAALLDRITLEAIDLGYLSKGELLSLQEPLEDLPNIVFESRPKGSVGGYKRKDNRLGLDMLQVNSSDNYEYVPFHEGLHWQRIGEVGLNNEEQEAMDKWLKLYNLRKEVESNANMDLYTINKVRSAEAAAWKKVQSMSNRHKGTESYYQYKVTRALADDSPEYVREYIGKPSELVENCHEAGKAVGLKTAQEYPGDELASKALDEAVKKNSWIKDLKAFKDRTTENLKVAWELLTGNYLASLLPAAATTTAAGLALPNAYEEQ